MNDGPYTTWLLFLENSGRLMQGYEGKAVIEPPSTLEISGYRNLQLVRSRGGMSYIYRGTRIETGQEVIVKLMPAAKNRQEALKLQYRFNQEVLIARLATSEHLLAATDHGDIPVPGSSEPRLYLVYPYIENGSLADLLNCDKPWETWELSHITDVIVQAAEGLFHLHKSGIVHQDVKPSNFLWKPVDSTPNLLRRIHVWLIDFGTAEPERKGKTRDIKGTLKYLAPEQIDGDIKYSIDQYALALLARLLLTGHEPPSTDKQASLLYRTRPTRLNPQRLFEPDIDYVLLKALAPDPADRFSSVIEFAQALQAAVLKQIQLNISMTFSGSSLAEAQQLPDTSPLQPVLSQQQTPVSEPLQPILPQQPDDSTLQPILSQQQLANPLPPPILPMEEEVETQLSPRVETEEPIVLPPLNPPKPYEPPHPRDSSQSRSFMRDRISAPVLPFMLAQKRLSVRLPDTLRMLAWSPDGTELACTFYHELPQLINMKHQVETLHNFAHGQAVCWSPDGRFLAMSMHDENNPRAEIRFCDRTAPKGHARVLRFPQAEPIRGLDWSRWGFLAIWLEHKLLVYDLSKIATQRRLPEPAYTFPLGDDMYCDQFTTLRWSLNGEWLAAGSNTGQIVCWQPHTARYFRQQPLRKNIRSINWSPDGRILIIAFANKLILFWDLLTGQISPAKLLENPRMVSVSAQTEQVAVATEKTLFFFQHVGDPAPNAMHPGQLFVAFSPDNKLATLDQHDRSELLIWQI